MHIKLVNFWGGMSKWLQCNVGGGAKWLRYYRGGTGGLGPNYYIITGGSPGTPKSDSIIFHDPVFEKQDSSTLAGFLHFALIELDKLTYHLYPPQIAGRSWDTVVVADNRHHFNDDGKWILVAVPIALVMLYCSIFIRRRFKSWSLSVLKNEMVSWPAKRSKQMTTNGFQNKYTQLSDMSPRSGISGIIFNANLFLKLSPTGVPKPNHTLLQLLLKHSKASQQSARDVTKNRLVPRCLYTTRFQLILSVRKFSGVGLKLTLCQSFGVQDLPKSGNPDSCPPK